MNMVYLYQEEKELEIMALDVQLMLKKKMVLMEIHILYVVMTDLKHVLFLGNQPKVLEIMKNAVQNLKFKEIINL